MSGKSYPVSSFWKERAYIDLAKYHELYNWSVQDPEAFWADQARRIDWIKPFTRVKNTSFLPDYVSIKWFEDGTVNAAQNSSALLASSLLKRTSSANIQLGALGDSVSRPKKRRASFAM